MAETQALFHLARGHVLGQPLESIAPKDLSAGRGPANCCSLDPRENSSSLLTPSLRELQRICQPLAEE